MDFSSSQGRRLSKSSVDPSTPTHHLHHSSSTSFGNADGMDVFSSANVGNLAGDSDLGGLGNLADELGDAFSDGEGEYYDEDGEGESAFYEDNAATRDGAAAPDISLSAAGDEAAGTGEGAAKGGGKEEGHRDSGVDVASPNGGNGGSDATLGLSLPVGNGGRSRGAAHRRVNSMYDGSEYGSESDLETPGMPPSLVAKIDAVESLARRGTEDNGGPMDGVCRRLIEELRDLGSQSNVEGGTTRLITAHSALTTHLSHQARQLHALAFPLFSPLTPLGSGLGHGSQQIGIALGDDTDEEDEEEDTLLPMLTRLVEQMPRPSPAACQSLGVLHGLTGELVSTLSYLTDSLQMARQTTNTATRRLRSAKELVAEMRRDEELRAEGERWLARGNWDERLRRRECALVCGDVVGGFEEVCNGWRARLLAQAEAGQALG